MAASPILFAIGLIALVLVLALLVMLLGRIARLVGLVLRHIGRFVLGEAADLLRLLGATLTGAALVPMVLGSIILGRWSGAAHFSRAFGAELAAIGLGLYRMLLARPLELLMLSPVTEGLSQRLPEVIKAAPGRDTPTKRTGRFEGYTIIGSLKSGGSGGKLYIAEPDEIRRASFDRQGHAEVDRVVIKAFSLSDGSSLPQIVRESRALDAAKKLDLVLDHQLSDERFYYVMRYVPGESLGLITQRLHAASDAGGLDGARLREALGYIRDLLTTLSTYHAGGLWHKDVKPDNIIINRSGGHLVDLGLVTPLRSAMTLTTHGTEYFRDPELVRMALRGVKVHQVDGAKFDIYAAGAVLYATLENSFPAHGGLSQITRHCPEAVRWIVRRAMTEYDNRYESAQDMLADLRVVLEAEDPFSVKPAHLPSVAGGHTSEGFEPEPARQPEPAAANPAPAMHPAAKPNPAPQRGRPRLEVTNWWTGRYRVQSTGGVRVAGAAGPRPRGVVAPHERRSAKEQLESARARAQAARERIRSRRGPQAHKRSKKRPARAGTPAPRHRARPGAEQHPAAATLVGFLVVVGAGLAALVWAQRDEGGSPALAAASAPEAPRPQEASEHKAPAAPETGTPAAATAALSIDTERFLRRQIGDAEPLAMVLRRLRNLDPPVLTPPTGPGAGVPTTTLFAARNADMVVRALMAQQSVLLVQDSTAPLSPQRTAQVESVVGALRELGVRVRGNPLDQLDDQTREVVARCRYLLERETEAARDERVGEWIRQSGGVDYVVWFGPGTETRGAPASPRLFTPARKESEPNLVHRAMISAGIEQALIGARQRRQDTRGG